MLEFLAQYGIDLTTIVTAIGAAIGTVISLRQVIKNNKLINQNNQSVNNSIKITREGIVAAFKEAKIPNEWKISVSNQVNTMLTNFRDEFIKLYKENTDLTNKLLAISAKILSFTAASDKLTDAEKSQLNDLVLLLNTEDYTIDITDNK